MADNFDWMLDGAGRRDPPDKDELRLLVEYGNRALELLPQDLNTGIVKLRQWVEVWVRCLGTSKGDDTFRPWLDRSLQGHPGLKPHRDRAVQLWNDGCKAVHSRGEPPPQPLLEAAWTLASALTAVPAPRIPSLPNAAKIATSEAQPGELVPEYVYSKIGAEIPLSLFEDFRAATKAYGPSHYRAEAVRHLFDDLEKSERLDLLDPEATRPSLTILVLLRAWRCLDGFSDAFRLVHHFENETLRSHLVWLTARTGNQPSRNRNQVVACNALELIGHGLAAEGIDWWTAYRRALPGFLAPSEHHDTRKPPSSKWKQFDPKMCRNQLEAAVTTWSTPDHHWTVDLLANEVESLFASTS